MPRATADHIEMELMLEHYVKIGDGKLLIQDVGEDMLTKYYTEIVSRVQETTANLQTTQHMIGITLDNTRNQLIVFDLQANLATAAISSAALVAGLLGMNLPNGIDSLPWIFPIVSIGAVGLAKAIYFGSVKRMGKIIQWKGLLTLPPNEK
ncbi:UNVERIFIED_CONTAM: magnesium ion transporter [Siphonaria sp. JEL0065]|nr:magnesium ion transporter [Siphonaria sp. JEL0065]